MKRRHPGELTRDGFSSFARTGPKDYALASLRLAIRAYCSTAQTIHGRFELVEPGKDGAEQEQRDFNLNGAYAEAAFETIVHLQHFAELVVKQALRSDHELLVTIDDKQHLILHRLLHGAPLSQGEENKLKAIEASTALSRACDLIDAGLLDPATKFIAAHRPFLEALNGLRNRLWHRGTFVIRYRALDELMGRFGLAFISDATKMTPYDEKSWHYSALSCGLEPLAEIESEVGKDGWSVQKVAYLKELARAAYEIPLYGGDFFEQDDRRKREVVERAVAEIGTAELGSIARIAACPVCGMVALVIYDETFYDPDELRPPVTYTWLAKCEGCTLELRSDFLNASEHGWQGVIEDYWHNDSTP